MTAVPFAPSSLLFSAPHCEIHGDNFRHSDCQWAFATLTRNRWRRIKKTKSAPEISQDSCVMKFSKTATDLHTFHRGIMYTYIQQPRHLFILGSRIGVKILQNCPGMRYCTLIWTFSLTLRPLMDRGDGTINPDNHCRQPPNGNELPGACVRISPKGWTHTESRHLLQELRDPTQRIMLDWFNSMCVLWMLCW